MQILKDAFNIRPTAPSAPSPACRALPAAQESYLSLQTRLIFRIDLVVEKPEILLTHQQPLSSIHGLIKL